MTFLEFCHSLGLRPGNVAPLGRWVRCPTEAKPRGRRGAWKLATDGGVGWGWDPGIHSAVQTWRPDAAAQPEQFDPARLQAARDQQRQQRAEQRAAIQCARRFYEMAAPLRGGHPYLEAHRLDMTGCFGLKVAENGDLVVPMYGGARAVSGINSVQTISPTGEKLFWKGAPTKGTSYHIDRPSASITVICEGLATGLAIFAAVPTTRIRVAFSANNLLAVASEIPNGLAVVAADNDTATEARIGSNPGVLAALAASESVGCGVAIPEPVEPGHSDWCDRRNALLRQRLEQMRPREREAELRRAVDAQIAAEIQRSARFVVRATQQETR